MRTCLHNFRLVDAERDTMGSVLVNNGLIAAILPPEAEFKLEPLDRLINGHGTCLLPAFVDLHAHFRDPGFPEKETLESASLAAAAGGYGSVVCMANTEPVMDDPAAARALKERADSLALIDLFPALSLTRGLKGQDSSHLDRRRSLPARPAFTSTGTAVPYGGRSFFKIASDDGKDLADDAVFIMALRRATAAGLLVSCHCDLGGEAAATQRALDLAATAECPVHIAHVSVGAAVEAIRAAKEAATAQQRPPVSAEATPHHLALTVDQAMTLGIEGPGRVNPPLATEEDRQALIKGLLDGTIDAIATDHAPHSPADKARGAPGFIGLETAFSVSYTELVVSGKISLSKLSALLSLQPAQLLGFRDRGRLAVGQRADFTLVNLDSSWTPAPMDFKSKSSNSAFIGRPLKSRVLMVLHGGRIVYDGAGL